MASREEMEERTDLGLVKGHAYGITAVKKVSIGGTGLASLFRLGGCKRVSDVCSHFDLITLISEEKKSCFS